MTRSGDRLVRLAGPMSRHPGRFAIAAILVGALGALGLLRFSVDSGQSLLVGGNSSAGQTYASFSRSFGSDPIVVVLSARNPTAPYLETNLEKLGALEIDLAHDPRVASVLGPGTAAGSLRQAALAEVSNVLVEYPYFVAETDYLEQLQSGNTDQNALSQRLQTDITDARALLTLYVVKAASDAHNARAAYTAKPGDRVIDSREKAVDAVVAQDPLPPLWAEYLAGPGQPTDQTEARDFFDRVTAAYGDCDDQIASLLKITASCQVFFERTLLDLPNCPKSGTGQFCSPKSQWAAVLPAPVPGGESQQIITVRVRPDYVGGQTVPAKGCSNPCNVSTLVDKINSELAHGIATDAYTRALGASSLDTLKKLGPLQPSECGGATPQEDAACNAAFHDARLAETIAGAPLLAQGVVRSMTQLLAILFPVALVVMLVILVALFRVRGRAWPLLAAVAATVLTVGAALLTGTPITPAVLAGVPVLVGLAVDYAVQFVARFDQERARAAGSEAALRTVLEQAGRATMIAALATIAGLLAMALVSGIDGGPLVAVPLVAEFALVLVVGVILAWFAGLFVALPLAVWSRGHAAAAAAVTPPALAPTPARTLAIADNWRGVAALAGLLAMGGWVALHFVPVQTDVQRLVSSSLPELVNVQTVQAETGYTNEVDVYVQGQVAGPYDQAGTPQNVQWQCQAGAELRRAHQGSVATATSIADFFIASTSQTTPTGSQLCVRSTPSPSPSPSPAPSASPSPSAGATPSPAATASPSATPAAVAWSGGVARLAATTASPSASPSPASSPTPTASPSPTPSPGAQPAPKQQTRFLCELRLFPLLSRVLVGPIAPDTQPCPPIDEFQQRFITTDGSPIDPSAGRIALGVRAASVADEARLVDELAGEVGTPPNGMVARPAGLAVLATTAYDNLNNRAYLLNLVPIAAVALALFAVYRDRRRALLPLLPAVLAAGWAPLVVLLLGRLPGDAGATLGSFNPLTVVLGGLVIALGTEFGVMLLSRFYEARRRGLDPDAAAGDAVSGVGGPIAISALTLGAGFAVLALSGVFPNAFPLIAAFGLAVVVDLGLAVAAVFLVMLPLAVALERTTPLVTEVEAPVAPAGVPAAADAAEAAPASGGRHRPGVSGRKRTAPVETDSDQPPAKRRPGVSGRRRGGRRPPHG